MAKEQDQSCADAQEKEPSIGIGWHKFCVQNATNHARPRFEPGPPILEVHWHDHTAKHIYMNTMNNLLNDATVYKTGFRPRNADYAGYMNRRSGWESVYATKPLDWRSSTRRFPARMQDSSQDPDHA